MARYLCLTQALVFRDIGVSVRKRFPTMNSLIQAGLLLEEEKQKLESIKLKYDKYWVPTNWIYTLIFRARREGKITHDILASKLCDEIKTFRYNLQMVCNYDWVPLPLVYTQAVFLATYAYFATCLIGRQKIITDRDVPYKHILDMILPIMTMIQFFFVIGWVKVAQGLLNPFGQDDDDFECNYLIDKNLATSLCIVDDEYDNVPEIRKDRFWRNSEAKPLYSIASLAVAGKQLIGSAIKFKLQTKGDEPEMVIRKFSKQISKQSSLQGFSRISTGAHKRSITNSKKRRSEFRTGSKSLGESSLRCRRWPECSADVMHDVNTEVRELDEIGSPERSRVPRLSHSTSEDHNMEYY
uniref:Bestrophin homolog n=1 Tax=Ascaris suum TaxID=6253 RepID=F1L9A1_ASCSU